MSHPVAFPRREPIRSFDPDTQLLSNATENSAIQQVLEDKHETMIKTANYLEALCANLRRQIFAGSHLSIVAESASSRSSDADAA